MRDGKHMAPDGVLQPVLGPDRETVEAIAVDELTESLAPDLRADLREQLIENTRPEAGRRATAELRAAFTDAMNRRAAELGTANGRLA